MSNFSCDMMIQISGGSVSIHVSAPLTVEATAEIKEYLGDMANALCKRAAAESRLRPMDGSAVPNGAIAGSTPAGGTP